MAKLLDRLKKLFNPDPPAKSPPRRDPQFVGHSSAKEIDQASPERVGELVGHPVERVDT